MKLKKKKEGTFRSELLQQCGSVFTLPANVSQNQCPPKLLRSNFLKPKQQNLLLSSWTFSCCFVYIWGWSKSSEIGGYQWTELLWYLWKTAIIAINKDRSQVAQKLNAICVWLKRTITESRMQYSNWEILQEETVRMWVKYKITFFSNPWRKFDTFLYSGIDCIDKKANRMCVN